jgi:hypothetical protein
VIYLYLLILNKSTNCEANFSLLCKSSWNQSYVYFEKWLCLVTEVLFVSNRVCHDIGIPVREISPSWSKHELWQEAFVTSKNIPSQIFSQIWSTCWYVISFLWAWHAAIWCIIYFIPVTGCLRLVQHVESVQAPLLWEDIQAKTWSDVSWVVKQFEVCHTYFSYLFILVIL